MSSEEYPETTGWKTMPVIATVMAPLFAVLWLGMALSLSVVGHHAGAGIAEGRIWELGSKMGRIG